MIEGINKECSELKAKYPFLFGQEFEMKVRKEYGESDNPIPELKNLQVEVNKEGQIVKDPLGLYVKLEDFAIKEREFNKPLNYLFEAKALNDRGFFDFYDKKVVTPPDGRISQFFKRLEKGRDTLRKLEEDTEEVDGQKVSKYRSLLYLFPSIEKIHTHILDRINAKEPTCHLVIARELDTVGVIDPRIDEDGQRTALMYFLYNDVFLDNMYFNLKWGWPSRTAFRQRIKEVVDYIINEFVPLLKKSGERFTKFHLQKVKDEIERYEAKKAKKSERKLKVVSKKAKKFKGGK